MQNFAPWYRREDYALIREIMEDRDSLPLDFDEWEQNAESEREAAMCGAKNNVIPVFIDPGEFFTFCKEQKISPSTATATAFARSRGAATYSMGL